MGEQLCIKLDQNLEIIRNRYIWVVHTRHFGVASSSPSLPWASRKRCSTSPWLIPIYWSFYVFFTKNATHPPTYLQHSMGRHFLSKLQSLPPRLSWIGIRIHPCPTISCANISSEEEESNQIWIQAHHTMALLVRGRIMLCDVWLACKVLILDLWWWRTMSENGVISKGAPEQEEEAEMDFDQFHPGACSPAWGWPFTTKELFQPPPAVHRF